MSCELKSWCVGNDGAHFDIYVDKKLVEHS